MPRSQSSIRSWSCRLTPSPWCAVPTVRAPPSTSPTTSRSRTPNGRAKAGSGTAVEWPTGVGAKGNEGVAGNVSQTKNAIGYVEYAYAKQNKLTYTALINKAGKTVQPTIAAFQAAASNADWAKAPGYYVILTDQPGEASWPITAATFILMHKDADRQGGVPGGHQVLQMVVREGRQDG